MQKKALKKLAEQASECAHVPASRPRGLRPGAARRASAGDLYRKVPVADWKQPQTGDHTTYTSRRDKQTSICVRVRDREPPPIPKPHERASDHTKWEKPDAKDLI